MEKTTLITANGCPYEREVPVVRIVNHMNSVALSNLSRQTGIEFKECSGGVLEGKPQTWEQFSKIFLTYNFLTESQNNWDGNIVRLRVAGICPPNQPLFYANNGTAYIVVR